MIFWECCTDIDGRQVTVVVEHVVGAAGIEPASVEKAVLA
jgi:hypothetical protein